MKRKVLFTAAATCIATIITSISYAELKPEDEITFRQSGMTFMRWNMGKIKSQIVDNPESYNKEQVIASARVISAVANSGIGTLFSSASETGKGWKDTRVKPEYFKQPDEVKKLANTFIQEADKLTVAANSGDIALIKDQFETLFEACKSCHKKFRSKD